MSGPSTPSTTPPSATLAPDTPSSGTPGWAWGAALGLLLVFAVQAGFAARRDSVTVDEFAHLPVGLYMLRSGDVQPDPINPPLSRMVAALPLLASSPAFDPPADLPHWRMGDLLMRENADDYQQIFVGARLWMVLLSCALGALVFLWARDLAGWRTALAALGLFAFSPQMLAHAHLATPDVLVTIGFVATAYALWRMLDRGSFVAASALGLALGVTPLLKLSGFVLVPVVVTAVAIRALSRDDGLPTIGGWLGRLAWVGAVAALTLNAGYGFAGSLAPLGALEFSAGGAPGAIAQAAPWLRLPLPAPLLQGVDLVLNVGKDGDPSFFLAGELSRDGWWYYHLVAFVLKTPLPFALAALLGTIGWIAGRGHGARLYCVYLPVAAVFASNSLFNSQQIGVRHLLPAYPLMMIGAAPWLAHAASTWNRVGVARWPAALAIVAALWFVGGTLRVAPRYLEYFNGLAGGPSGGHEWLIDSNLDWGQDLIRLREYMERRGLARVHLAYFGRVHPRVYDVEFVPLERGARGTAVVSASFLMGRPYFWFQGGRYGWVPPQSYAWLREHVPVARVGSMFVFELPG